MMNIWSLQKHDNIKLLLISLQMQIGKQYIRVPEKNEKDYLSVILEKSDEPDIRAYVSTCEQAEEVYDIHLEYPRLAENGFKENFVIYNELSLQQIIDTLITHFDVTSEQIRLQ